MLAQEKLVYLFVSAILVPSLSLKLAFARPFGKELTSYLSGRNPHDNFGADPLYIGSNMEF